MGKEQFEKTIRWANSSSERARQKKQHDRMSVFIDNFGYLVDEKIDKQFHPDNRDRLYKMLSQSWNILKKVVNLKSILYKKEAFRQWLINETPNDKYDLLMKETNINTAFQMFNKYCNVNNTAFMRIKPNYQKQSIVYEAVPSENIIICPDENNVFEIKSILHKIIIDAKDNTKNFYLYFDEDVYGKVDWNMKDFVGEVKDNEWRDPNNENRGIIPYVPGWAMQPVANNFWNETINDDLYDLTIQANVHLTHINNAMKNTCYKQLVFTGLMVDDIKRLYGHVMDGANPIALIGESAAVNSIGLTEGMGEVQDVLNTIVARTLDNHGIDFEAQSDSKQRSTAAAMIIRKDAMNDLRDEQEPIMREVEYKTAYYSIIMANTEFNAGIDINGELKVMFEKNFEKLDESDIPVIDYMVQEGYWKKTDVYKLSNPDISDEQAYDAIIENKLQNKELGGAFNASAEKEIETALNEELNAAGQ